jgi:enoyl-CoA hydratase
MTDRVTYDSSDGIATITLDDGKVNALSPAMQLEISAALERAEQDAAVVVLAGRSGVFSAGFDLSVLRAGGDDAAMMLRGGFELAYRLLSYPRPFVVACTGHAIAMGAFLMLSGDYRIGEAGAKHAIRANEVAIGLALPQAAIEICRVKLAPACLDRALVLAEPFTPDTAVGAGFLDAVTSTGTVLERAREVAVQLKDLDRDAHTATKLRLRQGQLAALRAAIDTDHPVPAGR